MLKFNDTTELLIHARLHVEQAVNSLNRDVKNCLKNEFEPAPFPAILFCFATINLLGALVTGRADRGADDKLISICYMTRFMQYSTENATVLIELFRHKLVHFSQPNPMIRFGAQENIPNPERNGNITIIATAYPDPDYDTLFDPDPNSISMSFSKENITFNVINEGIVKPTASKLPTWFSINFDLEIPVDNSTTLITTASGIFNIYKVQEFPQVNEIIHFARGTLSIGEERWDTEAAFIVLPQQPFSGMVLQGYSD